MPGASSGWNTGSVWRVVDAPPQVAGQYQERNLGEEVG